MSAPLQTAADAKVSATADNAAEWTTVTGKPRRAATAAAETASISPGKEHDGVENRLLDHPNLYCVRTTTGLGGVAVASQIDRLARGTKVVAFHRPMYAENGEALDWHLVVTTARAAETVQKAIKAVDVKSKTDAKSKTDVISNTNDAKTLKMIKATATQGLLAFEPLRLEAEDFPDKSCERDDTLYLPVPSWLSTKQATKHLQQLLAQIEGFDMLKPKQYKIIIPEAEKNVHRGKCFLKCIVRTTSRAAGPNVLKVPKGPPTWMTVPSSRLPFVRALLHDCLWPVPSEEYDGDEDPKHQAIICRWAHRYQPREQDPIDDS
jgi:hypothetical protein